jgi:putative DNA primase/helicase
MSDDTDTALLHYYEECGFKVVRLDAAAKRAIDHQWQLRTIPLEDVKRHVECGGNVAVQLGEVSGGLCCIDCDSPEAVALAAQLVAETSPWMPETLTAGRDGETRHYFYRSPKLGYKTFRDVNGEEILSIKASNNAAGHYVVVAPSRHPEKGRYEWHGTGFNPAAIQHVPTRELQKRAELLAVSALIARHLPAEGRHEVALCLAGYMLRNGEAEKAILRMLAAAWSYHDAPREAFADLRGIVRDTAEKLRRDEPVKGGRTLDTLLPGISEKIAKFLSWERADHRERRYERSDIGNAERFMDQHGHRVRWLPARKSWLVYDGKRWALDECGEVLKLAQITARSIHKDAAAEPDQKRQAEIAKFAITCQNESRINGMLAMAKPHLAVRMDALDSDRRVINCQNGTLDLRTEELKDHDPNDLITKIVPVAYKPDAPKTRFEQFLKEVLVDEAVIQFVKRFSGYTATGSTQERVFAILYSHGKNGKSTLVELLQDVLGDYASNTDSETLLMKRYSGIGNDVAALKGARFVSAAEVEKGRRLAESKVKQLTGSDTVTARFLFGEPFNFRPEFKLWLSTNNKPEIKGTDDAIWDRIRLILFTQRFDCNKADPNLPKKLREEATGVFAWMVEGCLEWQQHGLGSPERVAEATKQYRDEMDTLAAFIEDRCVMGEDLVAPAAALYQEYRDWCEESGEKPETQKTFGMRMSERGFASDRITSGPNKGRKGWFGIGLKIHHPDPDPGNNGHSNGERTNSHNPSANTLQISSESQTMLGNGSPGEPSAVNGSPPKTPVLQEKKKEKEKK